MISSEQSHTSPDAAAADAVVRGDRRVDGACCRRLQASAERSLLHGFPGRPTYAGCDGNRHWWTASVWITSDLLRVGLLTTEGSIGPC